jgi:hypothetical protein
MRIRHPRGKGVLVLAGAVALLAVAEVAYAAIPDSAGVYTACRLNGIGTIRLIDPSAPSSSLLGHCTAFETQISWNQKGPKGDPGTPGQNGLSPTVAQLSTGDSHCPAGGAAITDASGTTAYVCSGANGKDGADGKSFAGTFTSPSGQFSLTVGDGGVQIVGPGTSISLDSTGGVTVTGDHVETVANNETVTIHGNRTETVGGDENIKVGGNRTETVGQNETIKVGGDRTETVSSNETIKVDGALNLDGSFLGLNADTPCKPVARVGDAIDPMAELILTGSPDVCID